MFASACSGDVAIDGSALALFPTAKSGTFWPSTARAPDDSFYVTWVEEGDPDSEDLFLRHLSATLEPQGPAVRLTDLSGTGKSRARSPSLVTAGGRVFAVTDLGATLDEARTKAYAACNAIEFRGKVMRTDIGKPRQPGR